MAYRSRFIATFVFVGAASAFAQPAPIVQPGAPGHANKLLTEATARIPPKAPFGPDVEFMQGMIMHHSQAVEMVDLLRKYGKSPALRAFGNKISISQTDEIGYMKRWLEDRGKPTEMQMDHSHMSAADMKNMNMLMPGMLTPEQMKELAKARGTQFDRLFLKGMIQHHGGALTMVQDLFNTPGAGQDPVLFDFATDVDNTQSAEIKLMQNMLKEMK
jgi:uncharacterized protein (DUF305 family)